jgi:hypothetical protein
MGNSTTLSQTEEQFNLKRCCEKNGMVGENIKMGGKLTVVAFCRRDKSYPYLEVCSLCPKVFLFIILTLLVPRALGSPNHLRGHPGGETSNSLIAPSPPLHS